MTQFLLGQEYMYNNPVHLIVPRHVDANAAGKYIILRLQEHRNAIVHRNRWPDIGASILVSGVNCTCLGVGFKLGTDRVGDGEEEIWIVRKRGRLSTFYELVEDITRLDFDKSVEKKDGGSKSQ